MHNRSIRHFIEKHFIGLISLAVGIFMAGTLTYGIFIVFIDETIEYTVTVNKTLELSKSTVIGTIDSIKIQDNGLTKISLNEGTGFLGFDNLETYWVTTELELLPSDVVKITTTRYEGVGCTYYDSDGIGNENPSRQLNIKLYGDECGKYKDYEVEKLR